MQEETAYKNICVINISILSKDSNFEPCTLEWVYLDYVLSLTGQMTNMKNFCESEKGQVGPKLPKVFFYK